jgi:hypothetical protein
MSENCPVTLGEEKPRDELALLSSLVHRQEGILAHVRETEAQFRKYRSSLEKKVSKKRAVLDAEKKKSADVIANAVAQNASRLQAAAEAFAEEIRAARERPLVDSSTPIALKQSLAILKSDAVKLRADFSQSLANLFSDIAAQKAIAVRGWKLHLRRTLTSPPISPSVSLDIADPRSWDKVLAPRPSHGQRLAFLLLSALVLVLILALSKH